MSALTDAAIAYAKAQRALGDHATLVAAVKARMAGYPQGLHMWEMNIKITPQFEAVILDQLRERGDRLKATFDAALKALQEAPRHG